MINMEMGNQDTSELKKSSESENEHVKVGPYAGQIYIFFQNTKMKIRGLRSKI